MPSPDANGRPAAVVFDLGGVLLDWDPRLLYRKLFDDEAEMDRFLSEVCTMEWHHAHDLGVPPEQTIPPLVEAHPEYAEHIWAWPQRSEEMVAGPIDESVEILRALKERGVPVYALTNMETWTYPGRLDRFGLAAHTTLLIDDSPKNVAAARGVGMQAVQFESPAGLRECLRDAGLL